jgi:hypothetical protein
VRQRASGRPRLAAEWRPGANGAAHIGGGWGSSGSLGWWDASGTGLRSGIGSDTSFQLAG